MGRTQPHSAGLSAFLLLLPGYLWGQEPPREPEEMLKTDAPIRAVSETVLLDLVIRDEDGRPVLDLDRDEIEVRENGVLQEIVSFRSVGRDQLSSLQESVTGSAAVFSDSPARIPVDPFKQLSLVALVFERLPDTARLMARDASLHFLDSGMQENMLVAVFAVENSLYLVEHYTNDRDSLRAAVLKATSGSFGLFDSQSTDAIEGKMKEITRRQEKDILEFEVQGGRNDTPELLENQEKELEQINLNVLRQAERMMLYQRGHQTITALTALVHEEGRLAGRKTVVLFSAGIQIPHAVVPRYRTLISEANRANVSIYTVDSRGLHTQDMMEDVKYQLAQAVNASRSQMLTGLGRMITRDETMIDEYAETSIRMNGYGTLDDLARSTGGFLVGNTNDASALIDRVSEDIRSYYELAYVPSITEYDGKFREINVKVLRSRVTVQSRSGYFAVPPTGDEPVQPFEIPLLVALNSGEIARDFEHRSRVLRFGPGSDGKRYLFVVEVPLATFDFVPDREGELYRTRFSIMTLVKDRQGRVIHKFSQDYPLEGPLEKIGLVQAGSVVFMRNGELTPGVYSVETAVVDRVSQRFSTRRTRLSVEELREGLDMSSVTIVRRIDPAPGAEWADDPLIIEEGRVVPNLAGVVVKDPGAGVGIYCAVFPQAKSPDEPRLLLEISRSGQVIARGASELPPPDEQGVIKWVGTVPLDSLEPGRYEVTARVRQGEALVAEHAFFSVGQMGIASVPARD